MTKQEKSRADVLIREIGVGLLQLERLLREDAEQRAYQPLVDADSAWDLFEDKFWECYPDEK